MNDELKQTLKETLYAMSFYIEDVAKNLDSDTDFEKLVDDVEYVISMNYFKRLHDYAERLNSDRLENEQRKGR